MSFETFTPDKKPITTNSPIVPVDTSEVSRVAAAMREANITRNLPASPAAQIGTFSVSAMEERVREQEEDRIIQEIQDKTDDILESLESTNAAKLTELENDLNIAMEERNKEIKIAQLQSVVENIELAYEESKTPTEDRFSVEIEKVGALSVKINPEVSEILHDFRADLIENINNIEIGHRIELQKLAERAESALKKLNTKTEQQAPDSKAESPRVVSDATPIAMDQQVAMVQQAIKVGKEVKPVPKIEALDLRVSEIQKELEHLKLTHTEHGQVLRSRDVTIDKLNIAIGEATRESSRIQTLLTTELSYLQSHMNGVEKRLKEQLEKEISSLKALNDEGQKQITELRLKLTEKIEAEGEETNESQKAFQSFTDLANLFDNISREQEGVSSKDVSELENLLNIFTGSYSNNKRFAEQFDSNEEMKQWRINNLPKITAFLSAYKQQNDLGIGKLELSNIDPPKEGEDWSAGEWKMPSGEGVGLDDIPLAEKAAGWANNGDGNDDGLEGGVGASEPQAVELGINTNVIDGEYTTITEPQSVERTITNPIYDQLVNLTKQPTANMEFRFDLDGKEYIINNLEDFCTYVMLQDSRLLQSGFDRTTANQNSLYSFDLNANRALKLQKIRAGQNVRMTPKEVKDLFKYSFVEYIKHLSGVISDYEKNPNLVAENMLNVAKQQTMYNFEAVPMPAPAAAKNSPEAVLATEAKFDPIKDITNREVRLQSDAGIPIIYTLTGDVTYEGGQEMYKTYSGAILTREQVQSGLMSTDTTTTDDVESSIEQPSANQMPADTGTEDRNPFRDIPESVEAGESGTVSPAMETPSIEAVSVGEVGPTTENEPEMGAVGAEQADSITGGAGVEEEPAHTSVFGQMPAFEVSGSEPKMTVDEINKHREDIDALIGRKWIDASHGYVLIGGQLMDLMDIGKLTPSDAAKARGPIQAAITQIEKWKDEGRIYADLNPHLKTLRDLLSGLEAIEYDTRTKEAEIAAIGAEVERFSKSPEYLEIKKISETPTPLFGSSTTDLHKRLGSIEAASDTVRDFISRLRSADPKNEFLSEMNRLSNTLDNRYLDIERGMPDRYKAEIKSIINNTISRAKLINSSERSMSRVDAMIVELDTAQAKIEDMTARPELTNPIIRLEIIKSLQEIRREQDRMQGVKERFEKIQAATDKLRSQKDEATRKMAKPASTLTPADNPDQINDELARLDRMIVTDSDYSSLEAIDPDNSILKDRDLLRSQIENYLATLGGRKAELEQLAKIETFKTEVAAIESEMKSKFDELNADMERVYAGVIADLTTIPEEDSDETPLPSDRKALLAQRWEEYRIGRMRWKHQAIKLNDQFKGRLDALRSTIYTVRVPLDICRKFADTETAINKKFKECKDQEKSNPYVARVDKAFEVMIKRGIKFTKIDSFDQIKNGVAKDGRLKRIWKRITGSK